VDGALVVAGDCHEAVGKLRDEGVDQQDCRQLMWPAVQVIAWVSICKQCCGKGGWFSNSRVLTGRGRAWFGWGCEGCAQRAGAAHGGFTGRSLRRWGAHAAGHLRMRGRPMHAHACVPTRLPAHRTPHDSGAARLQLAQLPYPTQQTVPCSS
jgi:hypothetical protein